MKIEMVQVNNTFFDGRILKPAFANDYSGIYATLRSEVLL
jgi:hypothetical protein